MQRSFVPRTISPMKQILTNVLLKRSIKNHVCSNDIFISNYDTPLECNTLIYCHDEQEKKFWIYETSDIHGEIVTCQKVGQYPVHFPETPPLPWSDVGVFRRGGLCSDPIQMNVSDICGKVLQVDKYLLTCPKNVLNEK